MTAGAVLPKSLRGIALFILRGAERLLRFARNGMQTGELALVTDEVNILIVDPRIKVLLLPLTNQNTCSMMGGHLQLPCWRREDEQRNVE